MTARFKLDHQSGLWTATVDRVPAIVTQGRTLEETHDRVRAAIGIVRPDLANAVLKTFVVVNDDV